MIMLARKTSGERGGSQFLWGQIGVLTLSQTSTGSCRWCLQ